MEGLEDAGWTDVVDAMLALPRSAPTGWCDAPSMLSSNPCHAMCELADTPPVRATTSALHMVVTRQQFCACLRKGNVVSTAKEFAFEVTVIDTADPMGTAGVDAHDITVKAQLVYADNYEIVPHVTHAHDVQSSHFDPRLPDVCRVAHSKCAFRLRLDKAGGFLSSKHQKRHFRVMFVATSAATSRATDDFVLTTFTDPFETVVKPDRPRR